MNNRLPWLLIASFIGTIFALRLLAVIFQYLSNNFWTLAALLAFTTCVIPSVMALRERRLLRIATYISVGQCGVILTGLAASLATQPLQSSPPILADAAYGLSSSVVGAAAHAHSAMLFHLLGAMPAVIGAFCVFVYLERQDGRVSDIEELAGLARCRPWTAAALAVFLLSLSGIAPLAGFWGRAAVILAALTVVDVTAQYVSWCFAALAVTIVLNAVLTAAVSSRFLAVMYFRMPLAVPVARSRCIVGTVITVSAVLTIMIGLAGGRLMQYGPHTPCADMSNSQSQSK